jgi:hypothetical protein
LELLPGKNVYYPNEKEFNNSVMNVQKTRKILVYYVGGITYGEISAIRTLSKLFK